MADGATWVPWVIAASASATIIGVGIAVAVAVFKSGRWVGQVETGLNSLTKTIDRLDASLRELGADVKTLLRWQDSPTVGGKSPLSLTEIGKKVSDALNMPDMAERLAPSLKSRVEGMLPYDIQEFCFVYIRDEYQPGAEDEKRIKDCAYDNGLDRDDVMDALAIILRDKLIALNKPASG